MAQNKEKINNEYNNIHNDSHEHSHKNLDENAYEHSHKNLDENPHEHPHKNLNENAHEHPHKNLDEHSHECGHEYLHEHTHQNTKAVINRLSRAIGHLEAVKKMVEDGRDCSDVLIQLAAVRSAINNTGKVILQDHIEHCIVEAVEDGDRKAVEKLNKAINQFVK